MTPFDIVSAAIAFATIAYAIVINAIMYSRAYQLGRAEYSLREQSTPTGFGFLDIQRAHVILLVNVAWIVLAIVIPVVIFDATMPIVIICIVAIYTSLSFATLMHLASFVELEPYRRSSDADSERDGDENAEDGTNCRLATGITCFISCATLLIAAMTLLVNDTPMPIVLVSIWMVAAIGSCAIVARLTVNEADEYVKQAGIDADADYYHTVRRIVYTIIAAYVLNTILINAMLWCLYTAADEYAVTIAPYSIAVDVIATIIVSPYLFGRHTALQTAA